jgi:hypothetical protein
MPRVLRSEIVRGLALFLAAVETSNILSVVEQVYRDLTRQSGEARTIDVLEAYQKFLLAYNTQFTDAARKVMTILDIAEFADSEWWTVLIMATGGNNKVADASGVVGRPLFRLRFVVDYLPQVIALLKHGSEGQMISLSPLVQPADPIGAGLLVVVPEEEGKNSTPARVIASMESVATIYEAFAELENKPASDLVLTSCDSGGDKVFEYQGRPDIIDKLRKLLLDIWKNAIYFGDRKFAERLELIAKSLTVLDELAGLEGSGKLSKEAAELLRRKIMSGVSKFVESGSSIPEMSNLSLYVPRQVLAPKEALRLQGAE